MVRWLLMWCVPKGWRIQRLSCSAGGHVKSSSRWDGRTVCTEPPPVELANVRFLAGYRREWLANQDILHEIRACAGNLVGITIADAEQLFGDRPWPLVRPALMHLLWCHELGVDLSRSLRPSTVLGAPI